MSYNEWLDIEVLEDYLDGKLDSKTMHQVEKLSLEDPFVAEALAGLSQSPRRTHNLSLLQKQLQERIAQKPLEQKRWRITSQRLSIAAAAAVLFVTVSILFWMKENSRQQTIAQQNKNVEVKIAPQNATVNPSVQSKTIVPNKADSLTIAPVPAVKKNTNGYLAKALKDNPTLETIPVTTAQSKTDSVIAATNTVAVAKVSPAKELTATKQKEETIILSEEQRNIAARKAEAVRERPLAGKAEGIYVETNMVGKPGNIINGRVYTKTDGQPLPGAIVKVPGSAKAATTNKEGEFTLPVDSNTKSLSVTYLGYASQQVKVQPNQAVNVGLEEDKQVLNEVVVVNPSNRTAVSLVNNKSKNASPVGGWDRFDDYLRANHKFYKAGSNPIKSITLSFEIKKDGQAKNIKIVSGLSKAENEEAIRLVNDGPNWIFQNGVKNATLSIKF